MAYAVIAVRLVFYFYRMAHYEENLRATGFFDTNLETLGLINAASDLKMDMAVYIKSANGTSLSYDATYFSI